MSIDQNSNGLPGINLQHKSTQVNLWMIVGVVLFLLGATAVAYWTSWRSASAPPERVRATVTAR